MLRGTVNLRAIGPRVCCALIGLGLQPNATVSAQSMRTASFSGPRSCADEVPVAARAFGLSETVVAAVLGVESGGRERAVSRAGAMGCMQLMPGTWAEMRTRFALGSDPFDVRDNMLAGTAYLRQLHDRYGWPGALAAYNAGPGRYDLYRSAGVPLPPETRGYLARLAAVRHDRDGSGGHFLNAPNSVEWTQAPLFVVSAYTRPALPSPLVERHNAAANPQDDSGDGVAPPALGIFVGSRSDTADAPLHGIFVVTSR